MNDNALIAEDPPRQRPRGNRTRGPPGTSTDTSPPSIDDPTSVGQAPGSPAASSGSRLPASTNKTRAPASSLSREASTQPAVPAPTITKSYERERVLMNRRSMQSSFSWLYGSSGRHPSRPCIWGYSQAAETHSRLSG